MAVERVSGSSSLIDVLDRILDKGIVLDAWARISLMGIDLMTMEDKVMVASIDTVKYEESPGTSGLAAKPAQREGAPQPEIANVASRPARQRR